jgi:uncharacterized protein (DUF952 family)
MTRIFHITTRAEWESQSEQSSYSASSIESEGFIHASRANQIVDTANRIFAGRDDLVVLVVDVDILTSPLKVEDSYGHGSFPHVYGSITKDAILSTVDFPCNSDGTFTLPTAIQNEPT